MAFCQSTLDKLKKIGVYRWPNFAEGATSIPLHVVITDKTCTSIFCPKHWHPTVQKRWPLPLTCSKIGHLNHWRDAENDPFYCICFFGDDFGYVFYPRGVLRFGLDRGVPLEPRNPYFFKGHFDRRRYPFLVIFLNI